MFDLHIMENLDHILIFKTNISTADDVASLEVLLSNHPEIKQWNIDLEDVDCVLRVISDTLACAEIAALIKPYGFHCSELD